jgi:hypothetical protein
MAERLRVLTEGLRVPAPPLGSAGARRALFVKGIALIFTLLARFIAGLAPMICSPSLIAIRRALVIPAHAGIQQKH